MTTEQADDRLKHLGFETGDKPAKIKRSASVGLLVILLTGSFVGGMGTKAFDLWRQHQNHGVNPLDFGKALAHGKALANRLAEQGPQASTELIDDLIVSTRAFRQTLVDEEARALVLLDLVDLQAARIEIQTAKQLVERVAEMRLRIERDRAEIAASANSPSRLLYGLTTSSIDQLRLDMVDAQRRGDAALRRLRWRADPYRGGTQRQTPTANSAAAASSPASAQGATAVTPAPVAKPTR